MTTYMLALWLRESATGAELDKLTAALADTVAAYGFAPPVMRSVPTDAYAHRFPRAWEPHEEREPYDWERMGAL